MIAEKAIESGIELERNLPSYMLMEFLRRSEKASVIIIDEFDSPIIDSLNDKGKLERIRSEFSSFYSVMKNTGSKVRFLFITGVTKLSNMSIFSKMNNLTDVSLPSDTRMGSLRAVSRNTSMIISHRGAAHMKSGRSCFQT